MPSPTPARRLGPCLIAVVLASSLACPGPGGPGDRENTITRRSDDVLASGSAPQMADSVVGDAILAGGKIQFSGATGGDYLGAGGTQVINGRIHGSLRAAGGEIHVTATVDRNVTIAGGNVVLERTTTVARNAYLAGGNLQVDGTIQQGLLAGGGTVVLNGVVNGDVEVNAGQLRIGPTAAISGNLRYRVPKERVSIDRSARIGGTVTALPVKDWSGVSRFFRFLWLLGFLVVGLVLVALVPDLMTRASAIVHGRPGYAGLIGLGWLILIPVAAIGVAMTMIGLPLAFLTGGIYLILLYLGRVSVALWLGQLILRERERPGRSGAVLTFLTGGAILVIVALIPVLGPLVMLLATVIGVGALLLELKTLR